MEAEHLCAIGAASEPSRQEPRLGEEEIDWDNIEKYREADLDDAQAEADKVQAEEQASQDEKCLMQAEEEAHQAQAELQALQSEAATLEVQDAELELALISERQHASELELARDSLEAERLHKLEQLRLETEAERAQAAELREWIEGWPRSDDAVAAAAAAAEVASVSAQLQEARELLASQESEIRTVQEELARRTAIREETCEKIRQRRAALQDDLARAKEEVESLLQKDAAEERDQKLLAAAAEQQLATALQEVRSRCEEVARQHQADLAELRALQADRAAAEQHAAVEADRALQADLALQDLAEQRALRTDHFAAAVVEAAADEMAWVAEQLEAVPLSEEYGEAEALAELEAAAQAEAGASLTATNEPSQESAKSADELKEMVRRIKEDIISEKRRCTELEVETSRLNFSARQLALHNEDTLSRSTTVEAASQKAAANLGRAAAEPAAPGPFAHMSMQELKRKFEAESALVEETQKELSSLQRYLNEAKAELKDLRWKAQLPRAGSFDLSAAQAEVERLERALVLARRRRPPAQLPLNRAAHADLFRVTSRKTASSDETVRRSPLSDVSNLPAAQLRSGNGGYGGREK
eukprot:gnl/TRDRNA2_/TRDRNA2_158365_c0_seq1.p1 gnl/TRDRNA2_/TRDRNA2_158365_c0~~gnl/TRDRNA2_/TRDRNA2_158365_c0_seq1.p1  ORF type:complete len:671 (+),score=203.10 gnl/TRDRNA2_/TRDRNA2_158365_c0_seq1:242-2014(+)